MSQRNHCDICDQVKETLNVKYWVKAKRVLFTDFRFGNFEKSYDICDDCIDKIKKLALPK